MQRYQANDWPPVDARCGVSLRKEIPRAGRRAREHANILGGPRRGGTLGPKAIPRVVGGLDGVGEPLDLLNSNFVAPSVRTQTCVAVSHPEMLALVGTGTSALAFPSMANGLPPYAIRVRRCTIHAGRFRWDLLDGTRPNIGPRILATRDEAEAAGLKEMSRAPGPRLWGLESPPCLGANAGHPEAP
jgi:hypothetical protein